MFKEFIRRYSVWIVAGLLVLLANLAAFFTLALPKINADLISRDELMSVRQRQIVLRRELMSLKKNRRAVRGHRRAMKGFYTDTLVPADLLEDLVRERNRIAQSNGMQPDRTRYPSEKVNGQPLERLAMTFPLQGSYASLRSFINAIETSENYFLIIDSIELDGSRTGEELSMEITVSTYLFNPLKEQPPGGEEARQ